MSSDVVEVKRDPVLTRRTEEVLALAKAIVVRGPDSYAKAAEFLTTVVNPLRKSIVDFFKPMKQAADAAHKAVVETEKKDTTPLDEATRLVKARMDKWRAEEAATRQAQEAATRAALPADAPPPVIPSRVPKVKGVAVTRSWKFEIIDAAKLPREYLMPNEQAIQKVVNALGEAAGNVIPGIRVFEHESTRAGRAS